MFGRREFLLIRDKISKHFGLVLKDEKKDMLEEILSERLKHLLLSPQGKGLKDFNDYLRLLMNGTTVTSPHSEKGIEGIDELLFLTSSLSNKETYFFREMPQLEVAIELLSGILNNKDGANILCLGCSSGEEVYTLSILIHERILNPPSHPYLSAPTVNSPQKDIKIIGIDIDMASIKKAKEGRYTKNSLRSKDIPLEKYFVKEERFYRIKDIYKKIVEFRQGNILDRNIFLGAINIDMVFCRNVFIYMSDEAILRVLENIHMSLSRNGYLILGSAESITNKTDLFKPVYYNGTVVYIKIQEPRLKKADR